MSTAPLVSQTEYLMEDMRPPLIVGARLVPFLIVGEPADRFYCPIHTPHVEFPTSIEQIWRGEIPSGAKCEDCGLSLVDLA